MEGGEERKKGFAERSRVKRSFTRRKRASRGYMLPLARVEHGLPLRQRMLPPVP